MNSALFYESSFQYTTDSRPDRYIPGLSVTTRPRDDFIISKKTNGLVLSRYGDDIWVLSPYATTPKKPSPLKFLSFSEKIRADVKWLMFILIYMANTGRANTLSPGTLTQYMQLLKLLGIFCRENNSTPCEVLGSTALLKKFIINIEDKGKIIRLLAPLLNQIFFLGMKSTGINVVDKKTIEEIRKFYRYHHQIVRQHAVIPPRIFSHLLNQYWCVVNMIDPHKNNLSRFIKHCFSNKLYGRSRVTQYLSELKRNEYEPYFNEAVKAHGLVELFTRYNVSCLAQVTRFLTQVQHTCKELIHIYSGMRDSEAQSLKIDCLHVEKSQHGVMVHLLGETSKLIGQHKTTAWVTSNEVTKAVNLAKTIALVVAHCKGFKTKKTPLFVSVSYLSFSVRVPTVRMQIFLKIEKKQ